MEINLARRRLDFHLNRHPAQLHATMTMIHEVDER